jgi:hypothetical protein
LSSQVAALSTSSLQLSPQANHVLRGLVVCGEVTVEATRLVEPDIMQILYWPTSNVELLNPHAHIDIFHLE